MNLRAVFGRLLLVAGEVDVEVGKHVVFHVAANVAKLLEFRKASFRGSSLGDEATGQSAEGALQLGIAESRTGVGFEIGGRWVHGLVLA